MDKKSILRLIFQNITFIVVTAVSILNIWFLYQLTPLQSDIRANARDIVENRQDVLETKATQVKLMESISSIKSDVQYIRGKLEK